MYPSEVDKFTKKLNRLDNNTYVIEEEVSLVNGVYEGDLQHDNVSLNSINVYTGTKLTGDKITNFIVSTPSQTPWRKSIKIFSNSEKVYISYETPGDTIEAEDINRLQESVVNTQVEVEGYKFSNDVEVNSLKNRATLLENNKSEKTYVDAELNKRYLKTETYTKTETDQRIQMVINAAPAALDTLKELADALNNDPNFAATITTQLSSKVDKVAGKQLSTEDYTTSEKQKLAGIEVGANKYIHPSAHPGSIITEDATHRWTTDTEKSNWNDANSKKHIHNDLSLLETITQALIDAWNSAYTHISDAVKHITSSERTLWNTVSTKVDKITGKGLSTNDFDNTYKAKVDGISTEANKTETSTTNGNIKIDGVEKVVYIHPSGTNPHSTTKVDVGLSNIDNVQQATKVEFNAHNADNARHITSTERSNWNSKANGTHIHDDRYYTEVEADSKFVSKSELGEAGYGDMMKNVYDVDGDGVVDKAKNVDWSGVTGKPSAYTPSTHTHDDRYYTETEADNRFAPSGYGLGIALSEVTVSNSNNALTTGMYYATSSDPNKPTGVQDGALFVMAYSNIWVTQLYFDWRTNKSYKRVCSNGVWGAWDTLMSIKAANTWNNLKGV